MQKKEGKIEKKEEKVVAVDTFEMIDRLVKNAQQALEEYMKMDQEQVDKICLLYTSPQFSALVAGNLPSAQTMTAAPIGAVALSGGCRSSRNPPRRAHGLPTASTTAPRCV